MRQVPITIRDASDFVAEFHRHLGPPVRALFAVAVEHDGLLVGVALCGRPVARALDDGCTAEVVRAATSPAAPKGANGKLYALARRAAHALGYTRCTTTTLDTETGASLRGAGWKQESLLPAREGWDCKSRRRLKGALDGVAKIRWTAIT